MPEWLNASSIAASLSAVAAIAAALAAWRAPISAARLAEILRGQAQDAQEVRRIKLNVFGAVMQDRAEIWSEDAVRALNLLDIAFIDSREVRACWSELHQALNTSPPPPHVIDERIRRLLKAMATDLGLANELRPDDFARVYFPIALSKTATSDSWNEKRRWSASPVRHPQLQMPHKLLKRHLTSGLRSPEWL